MSKVDDAVVEIDQELGRIEPIHEGLRDYERLNLNGDTMVEVQHAIAQYDQRVRVLNEARMTLVALQHDGHPTLDIKDVSASVLTDLQVNADTIEAALKKFHSNAATELGLKGTTADVK